MAIFIIIVMVIVIVISQKHAFYQGNKIVIFIISALTYAELPFQKAGEEVFDGLYIDGSGHQLAPLGIFTANLLQKQIHEDLLHCLGHIDFISSKLHHCQHYCSDHCLHLLAYCRSRREWSVVGRGEGGDSQAMHVQNTSRANWLLM